MSLHDTWQMWSRVSPSSAGRPDFAFSSQAQHNNHIITHMNLVFLVWFSQLQPKWLCEKLGSLSRSPCADTAESLSNSAPYTFCSKTGRNSKALFHRCDCSSPHKICSLRGPLVPFMTAMFLLDWRDDLLCDIHVLLWIDRLQQLSWVTHIGQVQERFDNVVAYLDGRWFLWAILSDKR